MAVHDLAALHRRYVDLSQRFRAAWVFHQFLQSLAKLGGEEGPPLAAPFQELYGELKGCAADLNEAGAERLRDRLDAAAPAIAELTATLRAEDTRWPPGELRRFFRRFKGYDGKALLQLVRFYLYAGAEEAEWTADRRDKVDFLVTRMAEEARSPAGAGGPTLVELLDSLWELAGGAEVAPGRLETVHASLGEIHRELEGAADLAELERRGTLNAYRELKHGLGALFFEPGVLAGLLATNAAFRDVIERLYAREEARIAEEYQGVLDLGREVTVAGELEAELDRFHAEVERFERHLQQDEVRLDELASLRHQARTLTPRLGAPPPEGAGEAPPAPAAAGGVPAPAPAAGPPALGDAGAELLAEPYRRLLEALGSVTLGVPAHAVVHTADLFPFRLEPREVTAYRRLLGGEPGSAHDDVDRFILEAAAVRVGLGEAAAEARSLESTHDGLDPARLRRLAALGDAFVHRFQHLEQASLLAGEAELSRGLALLRVRLTREWSDVWLLAHADLRRPAE